MFVPEGTMELAGCFPAFLQPRRSVPAASLPYRYHTPAAPLQQPCITPLQQVRRVSFFGRDGALRRPHNSAFFSRPHNQKIGSP
jgi:hypothetical protein